VNVLERRVRVMVFRRELEKLDPPPPGLYTQDEVERLVFVGTLLGVAVGIVLITALLTVARE
jgi:hypothetical protein